ncbi:MAG: hypothetical protein Edafosvirus18_18 [Edafosvirus sp.]|uniref:Transmembrane protein n=1 Tax=Edafosvirus sp. TaxID=2487765 RepID=A0A3G4ZYT3_9VIRU|nr:MAG: hypothetical protein Edafosvirus18_18 [Edafosvirus sp.]
MSASTSTTAVAKTRVAELDEKSKSPAFNVFAMVYDSLFIIFAIICLITYKDKCDYNISAWLATIVVSKIIEVIDRVYKHKNQNIQNEFTKVMGILYTVLDIIAFIGCSYVINHTSTCKSTNPGVYWMIIVFLVASWLQIIFYCLLIVCLIYDILNPRPQTISVPSSRV